MKVNGARSKAWSSRARCWSFLREDLQLTGTHIGCETNALRRLHVDLDGMFGEERTMFAVQAMAPNHDIEGV